VLAGPIVGRATLEVEPAIPVVDDEGDVQPLRQPRLDDDVSTTATGCGLAAISSIRNPRAGGKAGTSARISDRP